MYQYHRLINSKKRLLAILQAIGDIIVFIFPILWAQLWEQVDGDWSIKNGHFIVSVILMVFYLVYLIWRFLTIYRIASDKRDVYRKQITDQVDSVVLDKYKMLCKEVYCETRQDNDVLLYDAHEVIRNILTHIKQLVSNITGVSLENISVNFIYKYYGKKEHWQSIDGSSSCSIGKLDEIVRKHGSLYHYLYANNKEYVFFNDKAEAGDGIYEPSIRDGDRKEDWGSIYCKRILCTMHQDRFVDGILAISTYNEKFTSRKKTEAETESLINEAVRAFINIIKTEMTALYIRHEHIKKRQQNAIDCLISIGIMKREKQTKKMSERERVEILQGYLPTFKEQFNVKFPGYFTLDTELKQRTSEALDYFAGISPNHML